MSLDLARYADVSLLFLRCMAGLVFVDSGYRDLRDPAGRGTSLGLPKVATTLLGIAEVAGGLGVIVGVLSQLAALGLILVMAGAIGKKIFVWKTGFWGKDGLGWNYELILVAILLLVIATDGGRFVLLE